MAEANNGEDQVMETDAGNGDQTTEDRKLFIGGLSLETREPQLKDYFAKFGTVDYVSLKMNPATGKSRCFAFVVFKEAEDVDKVFESNEHVINSKKVDVKRAKAKPGKIFIGGLKPELTDDKLKEFFSQYGKITEFEMIIDKKTQMRKGFGFITFDKEDTVRELLSLKKVTIGEHTIDLRKATPKQDKPGGGYPQMGFDYYGFPGYDYYGYGMGGFNYYNGWDGGFRGGHGGGKMRGVGGGGRGAKRGGNPY